jgi:hypothetical protein
MTHPSYDRLCALVRLPASLVHLSGRARATLFRLVADIRPLSQMDTADLYSDDLTRLLMMHSENEVNALFLPSLFRTFFNNPIAAFDAIHPKLFDLLARIVFHHTSSSFEARFVRHNTDEGFGFANQVLQRIMDCSDWIEDVSSVSSAVCGQTRVCRSGLMKPALRYLSPQHRLPRALRLCTSLMLMRQTLWSGVVIRAEREASAPSSTYEHLYVRPPIATQNAVNACLSKLMTEAVGRGCPLPDIQAFKEGKAAWDKSWSCECEGRGRQVRASWAAKGTHVPWRVCEAKSSANGCLTPGEIGECEEGSSEEDMMMCAKVSRVVFILI